jgi:hypothetical protein
VLIHVVDKLEIVSIFGAHHLPANGTCGNTTVLPNTQKGNDLLVFFGTLEKFMFS